jgi:hypothetical protein
MWSFLVLKKKLHENSVNFGHRIRETTEMELLPVLVLCWLADARQISTIHMTIISIVLFGNA